MASHSLAKTESRLSLAIATTAMMVLDESFETYNSSVMSGGPTLSNETSRVTAIGQSMEDAYDPTVVNIICSILLLASTVMNLLVVVITLRKSLRSQTSSIYLCCLAVSDSAAMWTTNSSLFKLTNVSEKPCPLRYVIAYPTTSWSSYVVVIITVERFIAVAFPFKAKLLIKPIRARLAMIILPVFLFVILGLPMLIGGEAECRLYLVPGFFGKVGLLYWNLMRLVVPDALIALFTGGIVIAFRRSVAELNRQVDHEAGKQKVKDDARANETRVTVLVLAVAISHFLLSLPIGIMSIVRNAPGISVSLANYLMEGAKIVLYANYSTTFLIYVLTSSKFRAELISMFSGPKTAVPNKSQITFTSTFKSTN